MPVETRIGDSMIVSSGHVGRESMRELKRIALTNASRINLYFDIHDLTEDICDAISIRPEHYLHSEHLPLPLK